MFNEETILILGVFPLIAGLFLIVVIWSNKQTSKRMNDVHFDLSHWTESSIQDPFLWNIDGEKRRARDRKAIINFFPLLAIFFLYVWFDSFVKGVDMKFISVVIGLIIAFLIFLLFYGITFILPYKGYSYRIDNDGIDIVVGDEYIRFQWKNIENFSISVDVDFYEKLIKSDRVDNTIARLTRWYQSYLLKTRGQIFYLYLKKENSVPIFCKRRVLIVYGELENWRAILDILKKKIPNTVEVRPRLSKYIGQ